MVEVGRIGRFEVEAFCIAVGNDRDARRPVRLRRAHCLVRNPSIEPQPLNILKRTFRKVEVI